jgi:hypothetical protein
MNQQKIKIRSTGSPLLIPFLPDISSGKMQSPAGPPSYIHRVPFLGCQEPAPDFFSADSS